MFGKSASLTAFAAALALLATSGCYTRKHVEEPQGDTPVDTGQASTHVRLLSDAGDKSNAIDALLLTSDGGYVAAGYLDNAPWILKTNAQGSIEWQEQVSATDNGFGKNRFNDVQIASDGGYVAAGRIDDRAIVVKFRVDGSIEWQWMATNSPGHVDPPNYYLRPSIEAMSIGMKPEGAGYVIGGGFGRVVSKETDRLKAGGWVVELTADGKQGRTDLDPLHPLDPPRFRNGEILGAGPRDGGGGIIEAVLPWAILPAPYSSPPKQGFWYAGQTADGHMLVGKARVNEIHPPEFSPEVLWRRSSGPGSFHAMQMVERILPDGSREPRLLLVGDGPDGIDACELRAMTGEVLWANHISAPPSEALTHWLANAIQPTPEGGSVLAVTTERGPAVLKLDSQGSIEWQYEYGPHDGRGSRDITDFNRGEALSVQVRADGGYRVAGHQNIEYKAYGADPHTEYVRFPALATVFDIDAAGSIDVNEKSGWARTATSATATPISFDPVEPADDFGIFLSNLLLSDDVDNNAAAFPTSVIVETASGPSGVLAAPSIGSNDPGHSFYWTNVPGASGFILFRSEDGVTFTRDNRTQQFDFDLFEYTGFIKMASFNGAGYSDYSQTIGPLGPPTTPTTPQTVVLTVINAPDGGSVFSMPAGINCGTDCSESFVPGTDVTLNLNEGGSPAFSSWTGCTSTAGRQCIVHMDRSILVTVNYGLPN